MPKKVKMNKALKAKWIAALRSGKYKQGRLKLRAYDNSFCCLGVLCDIYQKEKKKNFWNPNGTFAPVKDPYHQSSTSLTDYMLEKTGLSDCEQSNVMRMNDAFGNTFAEIADYLEKSRNV